MSKATIIMDEFHSMPSLSHIRLRKRMISEGFDWFIGEGYDDRFETEVGGKHVLVEQSLNERGELAGGFKQPQTLSELEEIGRNSIDNTPVIVDYENDAKRYTLEEAESIVEMAGVVTRLKERIIEHQKHRSRHK